MDDHQSISFSFEYQILWKFYEFQSRRCAVSRVWLHHLIRYWFFLFSLPGYVRSELTCTTVGRNLADASGESSRPQYPPPASYFRVVAWPAIIGSCGPGVRDPPSSSSSSCALVVAYTTYIEPNEFRSMERSIGIISEEGRNLSCFQANKEGKDRLRESLLLIVDARIGASHFLSFFWFTRRLRKKLGRRPARPIRPSFFL